MVRRKIIKLTCGGFSLIELMFGVSILVVVIIATLSAAINSIFLNESSRNIVIAANDAQYALEQIKMQNFSNIPNYIQNYSSNQFSNLPNENITFSNPSYGSNLDTITIQINWNERNATRTYSTTTRFAQ